MKKHEATVTTVTTTMVQEPKVGDVPAMVVSEYEKRTQTMTFVTGQVRYLTSKGSTVCGTETFFLCINVGYFFFQGIPNICL